MAEIAVETPLETKTESINQEAATDSNVPAAEAPSAEGSGATEDTPHTADEKSEPVHTATGEKTVGSGDVTEEPARSTQNVKDDLKSTSVKEKQTSDGPKRERRIKSDFSSLPETDDHDEIRKQVEFYFSDSNLVRDKFLLEQVGGSQNKTVPIKTIHSFKRMRRFQPFSAVLEALRNSKVLEVTEEEEVRRKVPLPEAVGQEFNTETVKLFEDKAQPRSIYAKGFGQEGPSTQLDIETFFAPYGPINAIRLRRAPDKGFKGSVFVEFKDEESQQAFLALEEKPKYHDKELQIMSKRAYVEKKAEDIKGGRLVPSERRFNRNQKSRDSEDWKGRREDFQKNGFKGDRRGRGRGGQSHRGGRSGRDTAEKKYPPSKETAAQPSANQVPEIGATVEGKKRDREDADAPVPEEPEVKKGKLEEAEAQPTT